MSEIFVHEFENGLTLIGEPMPWLESAAFSISVPAGGRYDPAQGRGLSNLVCEMVERGCGQRDSRKYVEDLEYLGVDSSSSASNSHIAFGGAMPADALFPALSIYSDVVRRPHLPSTQIDDAKRVCYQEIMALEDDLPQQVMLELRRRHYPFPYGESSLGTAEQIQGLGRDDVQHHFESLFRPNGTIIGIAGRIDWAASVAHIESCLGDWPSLTTPELAERPAEGGCGHLLHESHQTHIGVAYPTVPYRDKDYFKARGAVGVMSDGMSCRLFTEIREKRGLCYSVYATLHSLRDQACVVSYSGTSAERAQETLDVLLAELRQLKNGISEKELDRLKVQIRSSLVMQQESSRSRASAIAGDWYHLGKTRTLEEIQQQVDALTVQEINEFLEAHPPGDFNVVTLGPEPLEVTA